MFGNNKTANLHKKSANILSIFERTKQELEEVCIEISIQQKEVTSKITALQEEQYALTSLDASNKKVITKIDNFLTT